MNLVAKPFFKILAFTLLAALFVACGDTGTAPNPIIPDISGYSLSYTNTTVPQSNAYYVSISPSWDITPTQVSYSISPTLPSGVSLNANTGVISGSTSTATGMVTYAVTATGYGAYTNSVTAIFTITAVTPFNLSTATLTYSDINIYVNNSTKSSPTWTNIDNPYLSTYPFTVTYRVSPALPAGLRFNTNNGEIGGTPSSRLSTSNYTITAIGNGFYTGSNVTTISIAIAGAGDMLLNTLYPSYSNIGISYSNGVEVYTINISDTPNPSIANLSPQWSNQAGAVNTSNISYTVKPALPTWLSLNSTNGVISNTSTPSAYYRHHTVTATGHGNYLGTTTTTFTIAIAVNAVDSNIQNLVDGQIAAQGNSANLNIIDTSRVTAMRLLFRNKANFNGDISRWNVGNVVDMFKLFQGASSFNGDISGWNVGNANDMSYMFYEASSFNEDISRWNVGNVNNMEAMFQGAISFNQNISGWNVGNVNNMWAMFTYASSFNQNISGWSVSNVNNMRSMFNGASSFNQDISGWNVSNVNDMEHMFNNATSFTTDLEPWNVPSSVNKGFMNKDFMFDGSAANPPIWSRSLSYSPISFLATNGYDIGSHSPNWSISLTGKYPRSVSYSISPDISTTGLSFDTNTGEISGKISTINITNAYTVTARPPSIGGQSFSGASVTVNPALTTIDITRLSLSYNSIAVITNEAVLSIPTWSDSNSLYALTANYRITPPLPSGLSLDSDTGVISGSPTTTQLSRHYTIITIGNGVYSGSNATTLTLTVGTAGEQFINTFTLSYSHIGVDYDNAGNEIYTINISNTPNPNLSNLSPQWSGVNETPTNIIYTIEPSLPAWLGINSNTGEITNREVPTNPYYRRHTVTATGHGGYLGITTGSVVIAIAVNAIDRSHLISLVNAQIADQGNQANLNIIDTSRVTNMNRLFFQKTDFNGDISRWDVSSVVNMVTMFFQARSFNGDLSKWDVSKVVALPGMFQEASSFNGDISAWDVSNVIDLSDMFNAASSFNGDLSKWDVSKVTSMKDMFINARAFNGDISAWDVNKANDMEGMFFGASAFQGTGLSSWAGKLGRVTTMWKMFDGATAFTEDLESWNVPSSVNTGNMFDNSGVAGREPSWCTTANGCR